MNKENMSMVVFPTPKRGCRNCPVNALDFCMILELEVPSIISKNNQRHSQCPLQDITELLESLGKVVKSASGWEMCHKKSDIDKLYKALGGKE